MKLGEAAINFIYQYQLAYFSRFSIGPHLVFYHIYVLKPFPFICYKK